MRMELRSWIQDLALSPCFAKILPLTTRSTRLDSYPGPQKPAHTWFWI